MNVKMALRASHITRWQIVDMARPQSVAEHQYRVWVIAMALYDSLYDNEINSFDRASVAQLALTHDLAEVVTGDIPTPVKAHIPQTALDHLEQLAAGVVGQEIINTRRGTQGTIVEAVVKVADLVESLLYLDAYGVDREHCSEVAKGLVETLRVKVAEIKSGKHLVHKTGKFEEIIRGLLPGIAAF